LPVAQIFALSAYP